MNEQQILKQNQYYFRQNLVDWRWWYKLVFAIIGLTGLLIPIVNRMVLFSGEEGIGAINYLLYFENNLAYFTSQTNWLVFFWYLYALIMPHKEGRGKFLGLVGSVLVTTYISITCIIWNGLLLPETIRDNPVWFIWLGTIITHLLVPISVVLYAVVFKKYEKEMNSKTWIKMSWIVIIYPVVYGIVNLIRGEIRMATGVPESGAYSYFFLRIHNNGSDLMLGIPGAAWFVIAVVLIASLSIGMSTLYIFAINRLANKKHHYQKAGFEAQ